MNPFEAIAKVYNEEVVEADEKGYADDFKTATESIMALFEKNNFHPVDIKYLDGYFIFGTGSNSVVHFHIKECKNWLFGIWWDVNKDEVVGELFARHEQDLDKFKPSRSAYCYKIYPNYENYTMIEALNFIKKYPLRAWHRTLYGTDYNVKYVPLIKIVYDYIEYNFYKFKEKKVTQILDRKFINYVEKHFLSCGNYDEEHKAVIVDLGDNISPRYDIQCQIPDDADFETGCYDLFEDDMQLLQDKWDKKEEQFEKIGDFFKVWWFKPVSDTVTYWKQCEQIEVN